MSDITNIIESLIGDKPVSEQLDAALGRMALKEHDHDYVARDEFETLKRRLEMLEDLIGDVSVAEQIARALQTNK